MRAKIAMRLRRDALRRGAVVQREGMIFSKTELVEQGFRRKHNGYGVKAKYRGWSIRACGDDILEAYHNLIWVMDSTTEDWEPGKNITTFLKGDDDEQIRLQR